MVAILMAGFYLYMVTKYPLWRGYNGARKDI
ncbi:hypothetical protein BMS3Abin07_01318 [bacterium BMS3Abin07]|nr:hypothetical protein BMS3Abin07_01318 [bacterium BMS3Abin07]